MSLSLVLTFEILIWVMLKEEAWPPPNMSGPTTSPTQTHTHNHILSGTSINHCVAAAIRTDPFAPSCRGKPVTQMIGSTVRCSHYKYHPPVSWVVHSIISTFSSSMFFSFSLLQLLLFCGFFFFIINVWIVNLRLILVHIPVFASSVSFPVLLLILAYQKWRYALTI